jgi:hypothetical protein
MVAILNHRALENGEALPLTTTRPPTQLAPAWFLVVRRQVWQGWRKSRRAPPLAPNAHVALLEDVVHSYGDGPSFNALVHRLVGGDFYERWALQPEAILTSPNLVYV